MKTHYKEGSFVILGDNDEALLHFATYNTGHLYTAIYVAGLLAFIFLTNALMLWYYGYADMRLLSVGCCVISCIATS